MCYNNRLLIIDFLGTGNVMVMVEVVEKRLIIQLFTILLLKFKN